MSQQTVRFLVFGVVQGVGFRDFVRRHALTLGLSGYARNLADGSVEVLVSGAGGAIDILRGHLHRGPAWAEVRRVDESESAPASLTGFLVR